MRQIIINADDYGINKTVTAEIEHMIETGAISSTTVMANGTSLDEVKRFATIHPEVSYGVHLCLSQFDSITKSERLRQAGLTDENGTFINNAILGIKSFDEEVKSAIRDELNAQIDIVSSLGFTISHADSHHHVHTIYPLREIFANVLHSRNIKRIRLGYDFNTFRMKAHLGMWIKRIKLNQYYRNLFTTSDAFYSYSEFLKYEKSIKDEITIELMCHPGHSGRQYCDEMLMVEGKTLLNRDDIKLISYNELY